MTTPLNLFDLQVDRYRDQASTVSSYSRDRGLLVIPVMGPAGTAPIIARVHAPYATRTVKINYSKHGSPPMFPALTDTPSGDTLLAENLDLPAPIVDQQGRLVYGISGELVFVQPLGGRTQGSNFPIDRHPFPTPIDLLGAFETPEMSFISQVLYGEWNSQNVETAKLTSSGLIL